MNRYLVPFALLAFLSTALAQDISNPQTDASRLTTGTLPAGRMPAHTGDVTSSAGSVVLTLAAGSASNLNSGTLAAARGGAGTINGALKGNGSGVVSQAAAADLSDYATGSWTPTIFGATTAGSPTYTTQVGSYVKNGKLVVAWFNVTTTSLGTAAGLARIGGLPVTSAATANDFGACQFLHTGGFTLDANNYVITGLVFNGDTTVQLKESPATSGGTANLNITHLSAATSMIGFCMYHN